ncbi:hypothetical protein [Streptomyces sp. NPDC088766]|uniref:hypothetical protein n=1 Tax=Streptomyces sp. NPDC088766 TaxID=3365893 RepID=UPI00380E8542
MARSKKLNDRQLVCGSTEDARALDAVAAGEALPRAVRCVGDQLVNSPDTGQGLDLLRFPHSQHIAEAMRLRRSQAPGLNDFPPCKP